MIDKILRKLFKPKPDTRPIVAEKPPEKINDFDPRWIWDIYGTGIKPPIRPEWLDRWEITIAFLNQPEVQLIEPLYDELEKYLDDLDKHRGKTRELPHLPRNIAFYGIHGQIKVVKVELPKEQ